MKKYLAALFVVLGGFIQTAQAIDTYDYNSSILTLDSVVVNGTQYNNVTVLLVDPVVLSIGSQQPYNPATQQPSISATCSNNNLTTTNFNAIQVGMTLNQVNTIIGCQNDPSGTYRSAACLTYVWHDQNRSIYVLFDLNGYRVLNVSGTYKVAGGF